MAKYVANDTVIDYEIIGEGTPILFLHGWGMDRRIMSGGFEPVFADASRTYQRIYMDLPGMGKSVAGEIKNSDDMLEALALFVKDVIGTEIILAGESYGGYLTRGFVHQYPELVKAVIMLCPLVFPGYRTGQAEALCVMERDEEFLQSLTKEEYDSFTYMNVCLTKPVWEAYKRDIVPALEIQDEHFLNHVLEGACSFAVDELEAPFTKPCLIITGKQDTEVGYKDQFKLLEIYPNATYCVINKAGHNLQIEQPEQFQGIVRNWLKENMV
ncbi:MAG: alpha/beta hydrolase [bacterium]|nr:alpha/beta hydrolase [bacterium]